MKRIKTIEDLQDAIMLNKEIYKYYKLTNEGKNFLQILNPEKHVEMLYNGVKDIDYLNDPRTALYSSDEIIY